MRDTALFRTVRLGVPEPASVHEFYADRLGLPERTVEGTGFSVQAGATALEFFPQDSDAPDWGPGHHHLAFNIPRNRLAEAVEWLTARLDLLRGPDGEIVFTFPDWNAHAVYALDPAGNVVEWIARHSVENDSPQPFDSGQHLEISEVGVVVQNVPALTAALRAGLGLRAYGETSDEFAAIGDERGLFILTKEGRSWRGAEIPARTGRVEAVIASGGTMRRLSLPGSSLQVDVR